MTREPARRRRRVRAPDAIGAERTPRGRFAPGNKLSVGRRSPNEAMRAAVRAACTPSDVRDVVRMLARRARKGDVGAAALLLDRVLGKPRQEPDGGTINVPLKLSDAAGCAATSAAVLERVGSGVMPLELGERVIALVDHHRACLETLDLAARLDALEAERTP